MSGFLVPRAERVDAASGPFRAVDPDGAKLMAEDSPACRL